MKLKANLQLNRLNVDLRPKIFILRRKEKKFKLLGK